MGGGTFSPLASFKSHSRTRSCGTPLPASISASAAIGRCLRYLVGRDIEDGFKFGLSDKLFSDSLELYHKFGSEHSKRKCHGVRLHQGRRNVNPDTASVGRTVGTASELSHV